MFPTDACRHLVELALGEDFGGTTAWLIAAAVSGTGDDTDPKVYLKAAPKYVEAMYAGKGNLRPIHELSDDVAAAIGSIEVKRDKTTIGDAVKTEDFTIKVKAWDKGRALELLAKHFGLVKEQHEHSGKGGGPIESRVVFGGRYRPDGSRAGV